MSDRTATHPVPRQPEMAATSFRPARSERLERAAQAAHLLSEGLWEALRDELGYHSERAGRPDVESAPRQHTTELAERLADVAATVALLASIDRHGTVPANQRQADTGRAEATTPHPTAAHPPAQPQSQAVLVDERDEHVREPGPKLTPGESMRPRRPQATPRPRPWDASPPEYTPEFQASPPKETRDQRDSEKPAAWIDLIATALERFERDELPFAVLLIEVLGVDHLGQGAHIGELSHLVGEIETGATRALATIGPRPSASLALERLDRFWLQVPQTDRLGADALVEQLAGAVGHGPAANRADPAERYFAAIAAHRSPVRDRQNDARLRLAVGAAVCPEHGRDVAALVTHANVELAAMRGVKRPSVALAEPA